jgi:hypothetical protein
VGTMCEMKLRVIAGGSPAILGVISNEIVGRCQGRVDPVRHCLLEEKGESG